MKLLFYLSALLIVGQGALRCENETKNEESTLFGTRYFSESALIGILYDLKQTQDGVPQKTDFRKIVANFVNGGWDESVLNAYYRVSLPLYSSRIFVNYSSAETAPKAFGVENYVKPRNWVVHYKGQVQNPEDGVYRFTGSADDVLAVALNGKTVLATVHPAVRINFDWKAQQKTDFYSPVGNHLTPGDWFTAKAGEIFDIDILVGEFPGGWFGAWLFLEKDGETAPPATVERKASHKLPIFQTTVVEDSISGRNPAYLVNKRIWKSLQ